MGGSLTIRPPSPCKCCRLKQNGNPLSILHSQFSILNPPASSIHLVAISRCAAPAVLQRHDEGHKAKGTSCKPSWSPPSHTATARHVRLCIKLRRARQRRSVALQHPAKVLRERRCAKYPACYNVLVPVHVLVPDQTCFVYEYVYRFAENVYDLKGKTPTLFQFSILHSPFSILHSPFSILHSPVPC